MKVLWKPVFHLELVFLNHGSELAVATCLKANMKLNVAIWARRGHLHRADKHFTVRLFSSRSVEGDGSYHPAVASEKYLKITERNLQRLCRMLWLFELGV